MSEIENTTATTDATAAAPAPAPVVLTKEERIAKIDKEILRLQTKRYNIENDIVEVKAAKVVELPEVGADVLFNYGRKTATTEPVQKIGRVVAVKSASVNAEGKKLPAQIKVSTGDGFDQEFVVIYPAQIANAGPAAE